MNNNIILCKGLPPWKLAIARSPFGNSNHILVTLVFGCSSDCPSINDMVEHTKEAGLDDGKTGCCPLHWTLRVRRAPHGAEYKVTCMYQRVLTKPVGVLYYKRAFAIWVYNVASTQESFFTEFETCHALCWDLLVVWALDFY